MNDEAWQRLKDLFAEAREEPAEGRHEFLRKKSADDHGLFDEVMSLLEAESSGEPAIEVNAIDLAGVMGGNADPAGRQFGNYRIVREIGSGGMGTVFLAERDDGEFTMQVALKIVRQSIADRAIIDRFRRERQILADLRHPNIAALYDGGVSDKGEPYLAMEYVEGETLVEYADRRDLSIPEKLQLFLKVASAVSYAHRNLVVHRDIKPSNILVTAEGEPKLLDFGLAKAFDSDTSLTQTSLRAFTPAYASPEQIQGLKITTASDIYSLGVVFYELLTGSKPLSLDNKSFDEILQTLNDVMPAKPSTVEKPAHHDSSRLRGDLDNIALTALRKEPERRFKTVDDLAEDIENHLSGRPISAVPNTTRYLVGKLIQRNKVVFAAGAFVVIPLLTGLAFSLWQADRARKERDRTEKRFQDVRRLSNSLLFEISPKIERLPGSVEARELLVVTALEYLDSLAGESQADIPLKAELAAAYEKVADLQGNIDKPNLGDFSGALSSLDKAMAIRDLLPDDMDNRLRWAEDLRISSSIRNRQNDITGALADAERGQVIFRDLLAKAPDSYDLHIASIEAEIEHGQIYSYNNRYAEAIPIFRTALGALGHIDPNQRETRILQAKGHAYLGNALSWDGQQSEAEAIMSKALMISEGLESEFPGDSEIRSSVWQTYTFASSIYEGTQDSLSLDLARRALMTARNAEEADKADSQATYDVARSYSRVGITMANVGKLVDAIDNLRRSERILNELTEREPKNVIYERDLAKLYVRMGDTSEKRNDIGDALLKYQNSAVIFEKIADADQLNTLAQRDLAQSLRSIGKMQIRSADVSGARKTLHRAKSILDRLKQGNALGGFDEQLVDDVERTLNSI